jgi:threonyl-tRNA synthetase
MPVITLPDGSTRAFDRPVTGAEIAAAIGAGLARAALAITVDGEARDLATTIDRDARVAIVTAKSPEAPELLRHDAAHLLAEAVQELFPGTQITFGPAIETGFYYDFWREESFSTDDFPAIEARMREIVARDEAITREVWTHAAMKAWFLEKGERFKAEWVDSIPADEPVTVYRQGAWLDMCTGPHLPSTGRLGGAFKLTKLAGAYWRGDPKNPQLQRIYGVVFASQAELDAHLRQVEEAEKRDHRKLGREMDLFHLQDDAPGSVFWHPKGWALFRALTDYMRQRCDEAGYLEVNTPEIMDLSLWQRSGHWEKFGENMFTTDPKEERVFALKPMNCPGHIQIFNQGLRSYRELPLRFGEFGKVHRFEPHGALHGVMRVRGFTQDDAHIFCTEDQITEEGVAVCELILSIYADFGFEDVTIKFSDRPAKRVGSDSIWDKAEEALLAALQQTGRPWTHNRGEGAFYGPKLEFVLRDAIGRDWQCGTLQVDLNLPDRLGAQFVDTDGQKKTPVMLHRAMFGSLERFAGILIENYGGRLPLWLAPVQAVVAPIVSDVDDYAREVAAILRRARLRVDLDLRNEKIGYKVREHTLRKTPNLIVVGKREAETRGVSLRRLGDNQTTTSEMTLEEAVARLKIEARNPLDAREAA